MNTSDPIRKLDQLSWDDIRIFLQVVDAGSIRGAAAEGPFSHSTLRRRLTAMEAIIGEQLIVRTVDGAALAPAGERIFQAAREMQDAMRKVLRTGRLGTGAVSGQVSLSITEGLGLFWLEPLLLQFQRDHPELTIDLTTQMAKADVLRRQTDVSVQFDPPEQPDLVRRRLGRLHLMLCVSPRYEAEYGLPRSLSGLQDHKLGFQAAEQLDESAFFDILQIPPSRRFLAFRVNSSVVYFDLIRRGAFVGVMPTYLLAMETGLIPIDLGVHYHRDIYLSFHPDFIRTDTGRATVDFIKGCFDNTRYPFFADNFVAPEEFSKKTIVPITEQLFPQYLTAF